MELFIRRQAVRRTSCPREILDTMPSLLFPTYPCFLQYEKVTGSILSMSKIMTTTFSSQRPKFHNFFFPAVLPIGPCKTGCIDDPIVLNFCTTSWSSVISSHIDFIIEHQADLSARLLRSATVIGIFLLL